MVTFRISRWPSALFLFCLLGISGSTLARTLEVSALDEAPFAARLGGQLVGCAPSFYKRLSERTGLQFSISIYPIARLMHRIKQQQSELAIVPSYSSTHPPGFLGYEYLGPIYALDNVIITRGRPLTTDLQTFSGLRIGLVPDACWNVCRELNSIPVQQRMIRSVEQGLQLLEADRLDGILVPEPIYLAALHQLGKSDDSFAISYRKPDVYLFLALPNDMDDLARQQLQDGWTQLGANVFRQECKRVIEQFWPRPPSTVPVVEH